MKLTLTKCLYALALAISSITLLMLWVVAPALAEPESHELAYQPNSARAAARDAFACPGMHAEWLDDKTVQCFKEKP